MLAGSPPYFHSLSISGGPMPPPPLEWQPLQLYQWYRRLPWFTAYALPSYGLSSRSGERTLPCSAIAGWLLDVRSASSVALWFFTGSKRRASRSHAASDRRARSASTSAFIAVLPPRVAPRTRRGCG